MLSVGIVKVGVQLLPHSPVLQPEQLSSGCKPSSALPPSHQAAECLACVLEDYHGDQLLLGRSFFTELETEALEVTSTSMS